MVHLTEHRGKLVTGVLLYENKDYQCEKHEYKIDGNNLIVEDHGDLLNERYNVLLFEDENLPLLSLTTVYKNQDYIFHLEYSKDCKINQGDIKIILFLE